LDAQIYKRKLTRKQDQYLRSVADYRNIQARTVRETSAAKAFALEKFTRDLLSSIDNFEGALSSISPAKIASAPTSAAEDGTEPVAQVHRDLVNLYEGLKMTEDVFIKTLAKHGVEQYDPSVKSDGGSGGEPFDPNRHEAMFIAPKPEAEDGSVMFTQRKGVSLNGRVIRVC
jgi:molecular chaperone GrpE